MRTLTSIAIASFILAGTVFAQEDASTTSTEFTGALQYFVPGQDDDYDSGFGADSGRIRT